MASTFLDLLAAKVAIQLEALDPAGAQAALKSADANPDGFVRFLERERKLPPDLVQHVMNAARRCMQVKGEGLYWRVLLERKLIDEKTLKGAVREAQKSGRRVGELLVERGQLPAEHERETALETQRRLDRDNEAVAHKYRERGYQGIEAPSKTVNDAVATLRAQGVKAPDAEPERGGRAVAAGTAEASVPPELSETGLDEKYVIERKLGEGGMGAVYLAYEVDDAERERPMALKVVRGKQMSKDAAGRFKREILATSFCAHENIIEIYDANETRDGSYYMAMECIEGWQLDEILKEEGRLEVRRGVELLCEALDGLVAVHEANIVHRDIKPQNFRIWRDETGRERLKIMDFGIARVLDAEDSGAGDQFFRTMGGKITGSPAYISPEGITQPQDIDARADIYSLGISIYRMLTGKLPFVAREPSAYLPMHLYEKPPSLQAAVPDVPDSLEALYYSMLEKLPSKRCASCVEALRILREEVLPELDRAAAAAAAPPSEEEAMANMAMSLETESVPLKRPTKPAEPGPAAPAPAPAPMPPTPEAPQAAPPQAGALQAPASEEEEAPPASRPAAATSRGKLWAGVAVVVVLGLGALAWSQGWLGALGL